MNEKSEIVLAIKHLCQEKKLSYESVIDVINHAMAAAYRKDYAEPNQNVKAIFHPESGDVEVFDIKTVVSDDLKPVESEEDEALPEPEPEYDPETGLPLPAPKRFNPKTDILLSDAKAVKPDAEIDDEIVTPLEAPTDFGRMAAMTAKQVVIQKLREAERQTVIDEYKDREGEIVIGTIQRMEPRGLTIDIGQAQALMPYEEQVRRERYHPGDRIKVFIVSVGATPRGPEVVVSRSHPDFVKVLFENEVPEIAAGSVEIRSIAREPGNRSKVAVIANDEDIDPIGACVGQRGSRVQVIIGELAGEKIDIIPWNEDQELFVAHSLAPASVIDVELDEEQHKAKVTVADDQLSLAIGRGGQNARLASRLTGWAIDIAGESGEVVDIAQFVAEEDARRKAEREAMNAEDVEGNKSKEAETEVSNEAVSDEESVEDSDVDSEESSEEVKEETESDKDTK